jgi:hypothetical protein
MDGGFPADVEFISVLTATGGIGEFVPEVELVALLGGGAAALEKGGGRL